jgi:hypothetical protein
VQCYGENDLQQARQSNMMPGPMVDMVNIDL